MQDQYRGAEISATWFDEAGHRLACRSCGFVGSETDFYAMMIPFQQGDSRMRLECPECKSERYVDPDVGPQQEGFIFGPFVILDAELPT